MSVSAGCMGQGPPLSDYPFLPRHPKVTLVGSSDRPKGGVACYNATDAAPKETSEKANARTGKRKERGQASARAKDKTLGRGEGAGGRAEMGPGVIGLKPCMRSAYVVQTGVREQASERQDGRGRGRRRRSIQRSPESVANPFDTERGKERAGEGGGRAGRTDGKRS